MTQISRSETTEREWLEGLRYEDKFPVDLGHGYTVPAWVVRIFDEWFVPQADDEDESDDA